jgi:hypothetical protein
MKCKKKREKEKQFFTNILRMEKSNTAEDRISVTESWGKGKEERKFSKK